MTDDNAQESRPTSFSELERKTGDFLEKIRLESRRIVEQTRCEIAALRTETLAEFDTEREELERRETELERARLQLEADAEALRAQRKELECETFENAKDKGYKEGFASGEQDGRLHGENEARQQLETRVKENAEQKVRELGAAALDPLHKLTQEMLGARRTLLKNWEENIMQVAAAIAYQTIMRDPAIVGDVPIALLREALELAMNCATLKIRMNPRDVDNLRGPIAELLEETGNLAKSEVVPDPKISRGGCLVESSLGVVDERLESRLERIVAELSE